MSSEVCGMDGAKMTFFLFLSSFLDAYSSAYTVIVPDSFPSTLVDIPQTDLSINIDNAHTDPQEQDAVYEVMKATGNGWATQIPDVCKGSWHGIECVPDENRVLHVVSLSFGALSDDTAFPTCDSNSYISESLTKLPYIQRLFFYQCCNQNPQPIPSFLGRLGKSLESLVLRENGHVGVTPSELGNLSQLTVLDFHGNNLGSDIPSSFVRLRQLRLLDLSQNRITGNIPTSLGELKSINVLDLNRNLLLGQIPEQIGDCSNLVKIDLSRNRLVGSIPSSFQRLTSLLLLNLSYNSLSGQIPESLSRLKSLESLVLKGNPMDSVIPDSFGELKNLATMVLSNMGLKGSIPEGLGQLTNLRVLHLNQNWLNGTIPSSLRALENLSELRMNDNQLTGPIPFTKEMMWRMGRKIHLQNNSGLCYHSEGHENDYFGSPPSFLAGISNCEFRQTEHFLSHEELPSLSSFPPPFPLCSSSSSLAVNIPLIFLLVCVMLVLCSLV